MRSAYRVALVAGVVAAGCSRNYPRVGGVPAIPMITVTGSVLMAGPASTPLFATEAGRPVAGARVRISGSPAEATTDADGRFSIPGVEPPYDITVAMVAPTWVRAAVFRGLTKPAPTLFVGENRVRQPVSLSGRISGSAALGFPDLNGRTDWITFLSKDGYAATDIIDHATGDFALADPMWVVGLGTPASITGDLYVLQSTYDQSGRSTYWGFGSRSDVVVPASGAVGGLDVTLLPIASGSLSGTLQLPPGFDLPNGKPRLRFPGKPLGLDARSVALAGPTFSVATPDVAGAEVELEIEAVGADGSTSGWRLAHQPASASGLAAMIRPAPVPQKPWNNETGVTYATPFTWTPFESAVHGVFFLFFSQNRQVQVDVYTTSTQATIPDLRPFGVRYDPALPCFWYVTGMAPLATVDDAATAPLDLPERWHAVGTGLNFRLAANP